MEQKRYARSIRYDGDSYRKRKLDKEEENEANKKKTRFCGEKSVAIMEFEKKKAQLFEAAKRVHDRAARMGFHQAVAVAQKPTNKASSHVLRVDALGREIDEHGHVIIKSNHLITTLKVNMNKKMDAFHHQLEVDPQENPHFDPRMGNIDKNKILRPKRMSFQFVEQGKWTRDAKNLKLKCRFGEAKARELKVKQAHLTKAKDDDINPNLIELSERVPRKVPNHHVDVDVEWWDAIILTNERHLEIGKITHYIEHPLLIEPLAEAGTPPPQPLKLTKKELKKLRTQRRVAKEKEKQEMIRQGLLEPPKSKVKMSNLMKVLASEATQDPTKLEKQIRTAAAEREQAHADRNAARKLTPGEKREKKQRKLFDESATTVGTSVSVYKIMKLPHPETRSKVEMNAIENKLTGCSVMTDGMSVVVVEGNRKRIKKYMKLMLERINWKNAEEKDEENKCWLIWEGSVSKPSFHMFHVQDCLTESAAKKFFTDAGVAHYWDLGLNCSHDD